MLQQNVLAKSLVKQNSKLSTVLLFVEFNTTMALGIVTEQRDIVLVKAVGVTPRISADTA